MWQGKSEGTNKSYPGIEQLRFQFLDQTVCHFDANLSDCAKMEMKAKL